MSRILTGAPCGVYTDLSKSDLAFLATTESLPSFTLTNCAVRDNEKISLSDFKIYKNENLTIFNISGLASLYVDAKNANTLVPLEWRNLKKLGTINLSSVGLNKEAIHYLVVSFIAAVNGGLGSSVTTTKTLILTGTNLKYPTTLAGTLENDNLIALQQLGWTLQTNQ